MRGEGDHMDFDRFTRIFFSLALSFSVCGENESRRGNLHEFDTPDAAMRV
jgi:hypothetical protein